MVANMDVKYKPILETVDTTEFSDSLETWTFPETIGALILIIGAYLALVLKILPSFMKNRQPYRLKGLLICYNAFQVIYSSYLVVLYTWYIMKNGIITTKCPRGELLKSVTRDIFPYFLAKHIDMLDTVFFVLRKKDNQVTFLHVYHHSIMVTWAWLYYVYEPSDHFVFVGLTNSFVHVLMYAYYGLASLGPRFDKFVWWKKHLTMIQLTNNALGILLMSCMFMMLFTIYASIQFILVVTNLHYQQKLTPCPIPTFFHYFCVLSICSFFLLFMKFYLQSYVKRSNSRLNQQLPHSKLLTNEIYASSIGAKIK